MAYNDLIFPILIIIMYIVIKGVPILFFSTGFSYIWIFQVPFYILHPFQPLFDISGFKTHKKTGTAKCSSCFLYYFVASARKASALSVRSQGRSTSVRPKWPYAAVCL